MSVLRPFPNPISAVLFDGDGVLFESEELTLDAFIEAMAHWGLHFTRPQLNPWVGVATPMILAELKRERGIDIPVQEFIDYRDAAYQRICRAVQGPHPRHGIVELLDFLDRARIPYALGSNANRGKMDFNADQSGLLPRLAVRYCVDDVKHGKPAPDIFLRCAKDLGADPLGCVVVEDAVSGLKAARAMGALAVALEGSLPLAMLEPAADRVYTTVGHLHADLERVIPFA